MVEEETSSAFRFLKIKIIASLIDCRWSCEAYAVALSASLFGDGETTMVLKSRQFYCWSELQSQKEYSSGSQTQPGS